MKKLFKLLRRQLFCEAGIFHKFEIHMLCDAKGKLVDYERECQICDCTQRLVKPIKYHPSKYVWKDVLYVPRIKLKGR